MFRLPLRTIAGAPYEIKGALAAAEKDTGFLPLLRILANAPVVLETYLTVSAINARSSWRLTNARPSRSPRRPSMATASASLGTPRSPPRKRRWTLGHRGLARPYGR